MGTLRRHWRQWQSARIAAQIFSADRKAPADRRYFVLGSAARYSTAAVLSKTRRGNCDAPFVESHSPRTSAAGHQGSIAPTGAGMPSILAIGRVVSALFAASRGTTGRNTAQKSVGASPGNARALPRARYALANLS